MRIPLYNKNCTNDGGDVMWCITVLPEITGTVYYSNCRNRRLVPVYSPFWTPIRRGKFLVSYTCRGNYRIFHAWGFDNYGVLLYSVLLYGVFQVWGFNNYAYYCPVY